MLNSLKKLDPFSGLSKRQNRLTAFLSGVLASLALPPADFWPALFVAFSILVLLLDCVFQQPISPTKRFWSAFSIGWLFGFGYFVTSLYWIGAAFLVEADKFAVLMPLAVAALPAGIAIFWGLATGLAILVWRPDFARVFILAVIFTASEWVRGHVLTGFPWNTIGYTSSGMGSIDQFASVTGLYGVTFFVLICAMAPALLLSRHKNGAIAGVLLICFVALWFGGAIFKNQSLKNATGPIIRLVQPNIAQKKKWDPAFTKENIETYFQLSQDKPATTTPGEKAFDVLVWPETALPVVFTDKPILTARLAKLLPPHSNLIMGALRHQWSNVKGKVKSNYYNSILSFASNGQIVATYDKFHLVPFGEYLPGAQWLEPLGLRKIVALPGGFSSGQGPRTIRVGKLPPFSPLVCYEIGFPGQIIDKANRPKWIVNVTNDGWFGKTAGPYQHLTHAKFRAIEQGLPIVRAANTGISAVIDPNGTIIASLGLGVSGILQTRLPSPSPPTVYSRYGDVAALVLIIGVLIILGSTTWLTNRLR